MEEEHRITYKAGITRNPSDFLCSDGELAECINLATDNEELKPIVQPAGYITSAEDIGGSSMDIPTILYIHKFNNEERYIGFSPTNHQGTIIYPMVWGIKDGSVFKQKGTLAQSGGALYYSQGMKITSIGKTLIISDQSGMHFYLWKKDRSNNATYYFLPSVLPEPRMKFWLEGSINEFVDFQDYDQRYDMDDDYEYAIRRSASGNGIINYSTCEIVPDHQEDFNDLVVGLYAWNKRLIARKKAFCNPFFVRYAFRLYDGSYTHISNPILMFPCVTRNSYDVLEVGNKLSIITHFAKLHYQLSYDQGVNIEDYSDVIKDVEIFISDEIEVYDTVSDQNIKEYTAEEVAQGKNIYDCILHEVGQLDPSQNDAVSRLRKTLATSTNATYKTRIWDPDNETWVETTMAGGKRVEAQKLKSMHEISNDIKGTSLFYKLCSIGTKACTGDIADKVGSHVLENITTQQRLPEDDFYSRCKLVPGSIYSYNSRLNIANVERSFFEGSDNFLVWEYGPDEPVGVPAAVQNIVCTYRAAVTIKTDIREVVVEHVFHTWQKQGIYFFYPDARATHVVIKKEFPNGFYSYVIDEDLTEHNGLNGAYFFKGLPGMDGITDEPSVLSPSPDIYPSVIDSDYREPLSNYIIQSEVNNPWVYKAEGYFRVGTGEILGISTTTHALSQGQFGQYPLLVFSESGIWALSVGNEGYYVAIYPMSRDVCINPNCILQTDGAVFFVSKKGLMMIVENAVRCVSERMNGVTFDTSTIIAFGSDAQGGTADAAEPWKSIIKACQGSNSFLDYIRSDKMFMAYDYIDSRIIMTNTEVVNGVRKYGYSFVYNIADGTISKTILPAAMTNAVNNYPDYLIQGEWSETVEGQTVTHNDIYSFYEKQREEEVTARQLGFLLTRPMKLAGPVSQASLRELMNVGIWDKGTNQNPLSCVKTETYVSSDLKNWFTDISRFGAAARYYRLALFIKMIPTERLSGTIIGSQERRQHNMR